MTALDPHAGAQILTRGTKLDDASGALILLHGRGGSAQDILALGEELALPGLALLAPQAAGHSWYPNSFLAPRAQNEPWLASALRLIEKMMADLIDRGLAADRIALCGFSQGACLSTEFVAGHPQRYAALIAFTGGLIGPPGAELTHEGSLSGTPVLLSSGDPDPHVPWQRVQESEDILRKMKAVVKLDRYPGRPHTVLQDEVEHARQILGRAFA